MRKHNAKLTPLILLAVTAAFIISSSAFAENLIADGYCFGALCIKPNDGLDDASAINELIKNSGGKGIVFNGGDGAVYDIGQTIVVSNALSTPLPLSLNGGGSIFRAMAQLQGPIFIIENPHASSFGFAKMFSMHGFVLDGVDKTRSSYGLQVHGAQHTKFYDIVSSSHRDAGVILKGQENYGIYYSEFRNIVSISNNNSGFVIQSYDATGTYRIANVLFSECAAQKNGGYGFKLDYANVSFVGSSSEKNANCGVWINHSRSVDWFGGYTEANGGNDFCGSENTTANLFGGRLVNFNSAQYPMFKVFGSSSGW